MSPSLEVTGLRKRYRSLFSRDVSALDGLDMVVEKGQVHGFLGPNGSGKTTALRLLLGLSRSGGGTMHILGEPVPKRLPAVIDRIGAVVESPQFFGNFSGYRTLSLLARSAHIPDHRVWDVLTKVGLHDRAKQKIKGYSLGMRQRLAVATALLKNPELLILDEPTNGMDPAGIREMRELMRRLAADGMTVLVSSHLLSEVEQLCDTVTIVSRGRTVTCGDVSTVIAGYTQGEIQVKVPPEQLTQAAQLLVGDNVTVHSHPEHLRITGIGDPAQITRILAAEDIYVSELVGINPDLETVFLQLTGTGPVSGTYPQVDDSVLPPPTDSAGNNAQEVRQ